MVGTIIIDKGMMKQNTKGGASDVVLKVREICR